MFKKKIIIFLLLTVCVIGYAREFTLTSCHVPCQYIKQIYVSKWYNYTNPVIFIEINSGAKILARTDSKDFINNQNEYHFDKKFNLTAEQFPIRIRIAIGTAEAYERGARAALGAAGGATVGATIGAWVGGAASAICTFGIGAPVGAAGGAALGAAIGGLVGGTASQLVPVENSTTIIEITINSIEDFAKEQKVTIPSNDILSESSQIKVFIK